MANVGDKELALARVYSDAMLTLAEGQGEADLLLRELEGLLGHLDAHTEFEAFLASPMVDTATRSAAVERVFRGRVSDLLADALQVLNRKGRLGLLRAVVETYRVAHQVRRGVVDVHVRTAVPLSKGLRKQLAAAASAHTGKEAHLVETVDESLVGGMVVRVGDAKFDTSLTSRLRQLGTRLRERASREIHRAGGYVTAG